MGEGGRRELTESCWSDVLVASPYDGFRLLEIVDVDLEMFVPFFLHWECLPCDTQTTRYTTNTSTYLEILPRVRNVSSHDPCILKFEGDDAAFDNLWIGVVGEFVGHGEGSVFGEDGCSCCVRT